VISTVAWLTDRLTRFAATRLGRVSDSIYRRAVQFARFHDNFDYDTSRNGERALLHALQPFRPRTVFDVGANLGEWALAAAQILPSASVHAFEIVPETARRLADATRGHARIQVNAIGLADEPGRVVADTYPDEPWLASIVQGADAINAGRSTKISCEVTTGDAFCAARGIAHVDLLKLDVEGAEGDVLAGFAKMLDRQQIDAIQFEYGMANIYSRFLLIDAYGLLTRAGFVIGKLYPDGVRFKPYHPADEDLRGPNHVAVASRRADLVRACQRFT
jgi:FkbM family methyltransferase